MFCALKYFALNTNSVDAQKIPLRDNKDLTLYENL